MKRTIVLCLLLVVAACAAPRRDTGEPGLPAPLPAKITAQPTALPAVESGAFLLQWNARASQFEIRAVNPATGSELPGYAPILAAAYAFSADGRLLATVESQARVCEPYAGGTACRPRAGAVHVTDLRTRDEVTAVLSTKGWADALVFDPDGAYLAWVQNDQTGSTLMLLKRHTGKIAAQRALDFRPWRMAFSQEGTELMVYGAPLGDSPGMVKPGSPRVLLVDARTLETRWEETLAGVLSGEWCLENCTASHEQVLYAYWAPAVVPSHDGQRLYIVHADEERLTTVDFDARTVRSVEIKVAQSWFEEFLSLTAGVAHAKGDVQGASKEAVLSPDGKQLFVVGRAMDVTRDAEGNRQYDEEFLGLQVVDVESGRITASRDIEALNIRITPDGAHLLINGPGQRGLWTEAIDARSLQSITRITEWEVIPTRTLDGQPIILANQSNERRSELALLDPKSFDAIYSWVADTYAMWVSMP